ncbi:MAG: hypothetical protein AB8B60_03510 [Sulfitobacter sp.]
MKQCILTLFVVLFPALVAADTYRCETTNFGRGGWVAPVILVNVDPAQNKARVFEGLIKTFQETPIEAKFKPRANAAFQLNWRVDGIKARDGGTGTNTYRMTVFPARNAFTLSGQRVGYDNVISAQGTCKKVK